MSKYPERLASVAGKLYINGQFVESKGKTFEVINPATEEPIGNAVAATEEDVDNAVDAARKAFDNVWRNYDAQGRGRLLYKLADLIEANAEWLTYY